MSDSRESQEDSGIEANKDNGAFSLKQTKPPSKVFDGGFLVSFRRSELWICCSATDGMRFALAIRVTLVATMPMSFPNLVGVDCSAAGAYQRPDRRPFSSAGQTANRRTAQRRSTHRQFIPMLLPKSAVTSMTSRLRRADRSNRKHERQKNQDDRYISLHPMNCRTGVHSLPFQTKMMRPFFEQESCPWNRITNPNNRGCEAVDSEGITSDPAYS